MRSRCGVACQAHAYDQTQCKCPLPVHHPSLTFCSFCTLQEFAEYYLSKHGGRKLAWHTNSASCIVRAQFASGVKELQASSHQVRRCGSSPWIAGVGLRAAAAYVRNACMH